MKIHNKFKIFILFLIIQCSMLADIGQRYPSYAKENIETQKNIKEKFNIYMVLWSGPTDIEKGFQAYFEEQGIEANYIIRDCKGDAERCHALVQEIKQTKPDLIYTWGTPAAVSIAGPIEAPHKEEYIWDIPIVSTIVSDPVFSKIIYSLDKPGRNLTGVNHLPPPDAQLNTMLSYTPFTKLGVFFVPSETFVLNGIKNLKKEAKKKNIEVSEFPYTFIINNRVDPSKLDDVFQKIKESGIDIVYIPSGNYLSVDSKIVCDAAIKNGILIFVTTELMIKKGDPLMGLISNYINIGRFAAEKAIKILIEKVKTEEIKYETFEKFNFFINVNTMNTLKKYPPLSVIDQAQFIEK